MKIAVPQINTVPITYTINEGIEKIKSIIEQQPKTVIRQLRILLFPEYGSTEYYKLVFGRVLFWMLIFLTVTYLFAFGKIYLEANTKSKQIQLENDQYKKSWNLLYHKSNKNIRQKMDTVWIRSW